MKLNCFICSIELENACPVDRQINNLTHESIDNGGTIEISFGYGSQYDSSIFHGVICDECFQKRMSNLYQIHSTITTKTLEYGKKGEYERD